MTVPSTTRRAGPFTGTGALVAYPFTFKVFAKQDLAVTIADSNGLETDLVLDSTFTVTLNVDQEAAPGGTVNYAVGGVATALPSGYTLVVTGDGLEFEQTADLPQGGNFSPVVIENALDRIIMLLQRLWDGVRRSMRLPDTASDNVSTVLPVPTANNFIGWDGNGTALRNVDPNTLATVVAFAAWQSQAFSGDGVTTQFTLSSDPGNVNNLDVVVGAVPQRNNVDFTLSGTTLTFDVAPANGVSIFARWGQALPEGTSTLQTRLASPADGAGMVAIQPDSGGTTGVQAATVLVNLNARTRSVLDFIPNAKHASIRAHTNTDDLTAYFQNAAIAVNRDVVSGAGKGGKALVPAGRYRINKVGCRDTIFQGEGFNYSIVQAYSAGTGTLLDCALDRDGTTANTDGGFGGFAGMKIDGRSLGYDGVRTYGGFSTLECLYVTGCVGGVNIGLPIAMQARHLYSVSNSGYGFHTYSGAGDIGTSLTMIGCWGDSNGTYNFHIEQLTYSAFMSCASQNIPNTGKGWFVEGSTNGTGVGSSLTFQNCASEGDLGEPFYFKNQRGLVIVTPKFVSQPSNKNLITLDNATGTLNGLQLPSAGGGFYGVAVANYGDSNGGIVAVGGSFSANPADMAYFSNIGAEINGVRSANVAGVLRSQNSQSGNYTLVAADAYKELLYPSGSGAGTTFTIPANSSVAYPVGTELRFVNRSGNNLSIAITTDTMILAGTFTTGTRTLATQGIATAKKVESATWIISGVALT